MTDPQSAEEIRRQLEFICELCGAKVGESCHARGSHNPTYPHANRWWQAVDAGRAPLTEVEINRAYND